MNDKLRIYLNAYLLDLEYWCGLDVGSVNHYTNGTREFSNIKELCKYKAELAYLMEQKSHNGRSPTTENMMLVNEDKYTKTTSEEEVIQFISACWNKFGEHTATLVSAEQADIELF